jgi:hypothetical protein
MAPFGGPFLCAACSWKVHRTYVMVATPLAGAPTIPELLPRAASPRDGAARVFE